MDCIEISHGTAVESGETVNPPDEWGYPDTTESILGGEFGHILQSLDLRELSM